MMLYAMLYNFNLWVYNWLCSLFSNSSFFLIVVSIYNIACYITMNIAVSQGYIMIAML